MTQATEVLAPHPRERNQADRRRVPRAPRQPLLHGAAGAAVRIHPGGLRRELYRAWPRAHRLQRGLGGDADAGRLLRRSHRRAHQSDRRPAARVPPPSRWRGWSIRSGCSSRCTPSWDSPTRSTIRPTTRCCSERVAPRRITQVFSFHTCSGMIGSAIAPVTLLFMQSMVGWRGAFICAAALGRRRGARSGLAGRAAGLPLRAHAQSRTRTRPQARPPTACGFCCRRRSCSTSCSSSCCRWSAAASISTWSWAWGRCTGRRPRSPTPRSPACSP